MRPGHTPHVRAAPFRHQLLSLCLPVQHVLTLPANLGGVGAQERLPSRGRYGHVALAKVSPAR